MPVSFQLVLDAVPFTVQWLSLQDDSEDLVVKITLKYGKKKMCGFPYGVSYLEGMMLCSCLLLMFICYTHYISLLRKTVCRQPVFLFVVVV